MKNDNNMILVQLTSILQDLYFLMLYVIFYITQHFY